MATRPASIRHPGRALRNDFYQRWHGNEEQLQVQRGEAETSYLATKPADFSARVVWVEEKPYEIPAAGRISVQFPDREPTPQMFEFEFELVPTEAVG